MKTVRRNTRNITERNKIRLKKNKTQATIRKNKQISNIIKITYMGKVS